MAPLRQKEKNNTYLSICLSESEWLNELFQDPAIRLTLPPKRLLIVSVYSSILHILDSILCTNHIFIFHIWHFGGLEDLGRGCSSQTYLIPRGSHSLPRNTPMICIPTNQSPYLRLLSWSHSHTLSQWSPCPKSPRARDQTARPWSPEPTKIIQTTWYWAYSAHRLPSSFLSSKRPRPVIPLCSCCLLIYPWASPGGPANRGVPLSLGTVGGQVSSGAAVSRSANLATPDENKSWVCFTTLWHHPYRGTLASLQPFLLPNP